MVRSLESKGEYQEVWNTDAALEKEATLLEQIRKISGRRTRALALAFMALSSSGCGVAANATGRMIRGMPPFESMERRPTAEERAQAEAKAVEYRRSVEALSCKGTNFCASRVSERHWVFKDRDNVAYTLRTSEDGRSIIFEGKGLRESFPFRPRSNYGYEYYGLTIKVFGLSFFAYGDNLSSSRNDGWRRIKAIQQHHNLYEARWDPLKPSFSVTEKHPN